MISIIIPTLNEERAIPDTLDNVLSQSGEFEVIVVDGGSSDRTVDLLTRRSEHDDRLQIVVAPKGRASQMNVGAARARGEWLVFLHADTLLPIDAISTLGALPAGTEAGGFRHRFSGAGWGLRVVSWLHNVRCRCTKVVYGDQVLFILRTLFSQVGGFPNVPILEDILLGEKLVKLTRPIILDDCVITDSRKFEKEGVWLSLWRVVLIQLSHVFGLPTPALRFFAGIR